MSDHGLLKGHKSPHELMNKKTYVLQFPNPFDDSNSDLESIMELNQARKQFFKVFKSSRKIQRPQDKIHKENELKAPLQTTLDSLAIPDMVRKSVTWLFGDQPGTDKILKKDFLIAMISSVLFTIQYELNLQYSILTSRDKDEIFCEISATEEWLEKKAQAVGYRLQFRKEHDEINRNNIEKYPFKEVSPYAKFEIPEIFKNPEDVKRIFKHFDPNEEETESGGTLFRYIDRVRLIRNSLNTRLDLHIMKEFEISIEDFCIHSEEPLDQLKKDWATLSKVFSSQPLDSVRNYFGEKAALYFAWMETYKNFMISAGILGLIVQGILFFSYVDNQYNSLGQLMQVLFALFLAFWASTFDQVWTRREKIFAWRWGTTNFYEEEEQRGEFKGKMARDPVTNTMKRKRINSNWHTLKKFISYTLILVFIICVLAMIFSILFFRYFLISENLTLLGMILGGVLNALQIRFMNIIYDKLAETLNNWENHETETEYNNLLAIKVFIFRFVNSYASLFYLAFYADDAYCGDGTCMDYLSIQLTIIFFISIIMNALEVFVPWMLMKKRLITEDIKIAAMQQKNPELRKNLSPVERESKCESYESPLYDYIEMIIEFGYVAMFGTALPALPMLLLFEIIIEIRVDAWKICNICKRADPHRSEDIGVFKDIILTIAYAGAINNSGLIIFTTGVMETLFPVAQNSTAIETMNSTISAFTYLANSTNITESVEANYTIEYGGFEYLLAFVILEHFLLLGMFLISVMIPDDPEVVTKGLIWSERIVNERLYQSKGTAKMNFGVSIVKMAMSAMDKKIDEDFMLTENKIKYNED